jgi:hypothetical protein
MSRRNSWTEAEEAWLQERYPTMHYDELAAEHAERFPDLPIRSKKAVNSRAKRLGLRKAEGYVRNESRFWTPERVAWLEGFVPGHTETEIRDEFERTFGTPLSRSQIKNAKMHFGVKSGTRGGQFARHHEPFNKGKRWNDYLSPEQQARSRATCFRKGNRPHNEGNLLDERLTKYGWQVKVDPRNAKHPGGYWIARGIFAWMQANGRDWPEGCRCVHADHDLENDDPGNIVPVPNELAAIVTGGKSGIAYYDAESLESAILQAKVRMATRKLEHRPRPCAICGKTFTPANSGEQRTCPECWAAGLGRRGRRKKA